MARRTGWLSRSAPLGRGAAVIASASELRDRHLLLVPTTVLIEDVDQLIRARVPTCVLAVDGQTGLGRRSTFAGPYELSMEDAVDAGVPMPWTIAYALTCPVEREDPPPRGADDRDGFANAFPAGMPWREEGRALHLLVAMARRLHGVVRIAGGGMITPDPDRAVDLLIHSQYWLEPETLLPVVRRVLPDAALAIDGQEWEGPPDDVYSGYATDAVTAHAPLHPHDLARLHDQADTHDLGKLVLDDVIDGYAVVGEIGANGDSDGAIEVLVHVGRAKEPAVVGQPWAGDPFVTYEVRWSSPFWEERERRQPFQAYLASRARSQPMVAAVARVVIEATGGVVTDEDGFWLDRYGL